MATVSDAPFKYHREAKSIPAEILAALCPGELRLRIARAAEIEEMADILGPGAGSTLLTRSRKVLDSEPVYDFVQRQRKLMIMIEEMGRIEGRDICAGRQKHADDNEYPIGLPEAIDTACIGNHVNPFYADLAADILAHHDH